MRGAGPRLGLPYDAGSFAAAGDDKSVSRGARTGRGRRGGPLRLGGAVQGRNAPELSWTVLRFREIFIALQADGNANLGFGRLCFSRLNCELELPAVISGLDDAQNVAPATDAHIFTERDLRGHLQGEFDFRAFVERHIGEQKGSAGTQILGEAEPFGGGGNVTQGNREVKSEALSNAAFNANRRIRHGRVTSFGNRREEGNSNCHCSAVGPVWEVKNLCVSVHWPQPAASVENCRGCALTICKL